MMECQHLLAGNGVIGGVREGFVDEDDNDEEVDRFIGKMGLTVSDGDDNEMKLSKYLKMSDDKEKNYKMERGHKELRKLEWDINDVSMGDVGDKVKRS